MPLALYHRSQIRLDLIATALAAFTTFAVAQESKPAAAPAAPAATKQIADEMIHITRLRDLDIIEPGGQRSFVSAASGLVRTGSYFHVVSDDELYLASFSVSDEKPGQLLRILDGHLPEEAAARKKQKPDFEVLLSLPPDAKNPDGALLALGSGSRLNRRRGVIITLAADGKALSSHTIDLAPLFTPLDTRLKEVNIEGAVILGNEFLLFQRGNADTAVNAIVAYSLDATLKFLADPTVALPAPDIRKVGLGAAKGVPLGFTDAAALPDGRIVFSAAAEASSNAYDDGALAGAIIGLMDKTGIVLSKQSLSPMVKVEGIAARLERNSIHLNLVTDADDPKVAASLYETNLGLK